MNIRQAIIILILAPFSLGALAATTPGSDMTQADTTALRADAALATPQPEDATLRAETTSVKSFLQKMDPTIKFGGYIVGRYSVSDRAGQSSNSSFDLRFVRLYASGYCFQDFFYRLQLEVNDAPGNDRGPRVLDAFVEWQHWKELRVKVGQFKRPIGFENPYSPLDVGMGSFSQLSMKLASIGDRNGEHRTSGRDLGIQLQGDLFPASSDGHPWLHYQVGLFNGQGINHSDRDNFKDLIGGLWISPVKELSIGGFGWNGRYTNENYADDGSQWKSVARKRWGVGLKYEGNFSLRGEYMASVGGVASNAAAPRRSDAWYATLGYPLAKNFKLYGRWDCYRDAKTWSSLKTVWGLAGNYYLGKNFILQATYSFTDDRSAAVGQHYNTLDLQVYARF